MTELQMKLVLAIVSQLDRYVIDGTWPDEQCRYCLGQSDGYPDSQSFTHMDECIVPLIQQLRETMWNREEV